MPTEPGFVTRFYTERGFRVTSLFGPRPDPFDPNKTDFHTGIDFGGQPRGTPVPSTLAGSVYGARFYSGWGNMVVVTDSSGYNHLFAHLDSIRVTVGTVVSREDVVGTIGSTGNATGPHLHYQINRPGTGVRGDGYFGDPNDYIFDEVNEEVERGIVLGGDADYYNAAPLRDRLNCPIFFRSALGSLHLVKTVFVCGGPLDQVQEAAPGAEIINLSGSNRFDTAGKIREYLNSN